MQMPITQMRKILSLSQADLARELGVDVITVSRWERGVTAPSRIASKLLQPFMERAENQTKSNQSSALLEVI